MRTTTVPTPRTATRTGSAVIADAADGGRRTAGTPGRRRRRAALAALPALGLFAGVAVAGPASAAEPTCATDCVGTPSVSRAMGEAYIWYPSTTATKGTLTLKYLGGAHIKTFSETAFSTSHTTHTGKILTPGAWYQYLISATDAQGRTWNESGTFRSAERTVTLTFDTVHVTDDSDTGAGELSAWGKVGNQEIKLWNEQSISAVKSVKVGKSVTMKHPAATLGYQVYVSDNDQDWGEFCTGGSAPAYTVIENSCMDANVAKRSVALPDSIGNHTLVSSASAADRRLDFGVDVTIKVSVA